MSNNDLMSTLMSVLSNPDAKEKLGDLVSSLGGNSSNGGNNEAQTAASQSENFSLPQPSASSGSMDQSMDMVVKIKSMLDQFNNTDDSRINLLTSIKPYMRNGRGRNIDMAVKFIQLLNFTSGFKNG